MSRFLYADHAATTRLSPGALAAMMPHLQEAYGNPSSLYSFGQQAKADLEAARADIAACLNARPEELYFTSCGTEADNWALRGWRSSVRRRAGTSLPPPSSTTPSSTRPSTWKSRAMR